MYEWENGESGNLVVRVSNVSTVDDLPELAREKLDQVPQVMAPPAETPGYYFFVMPPHDVFIREY